MHKIMDIAAPQASTDRLWWKGAVIYQVYPRSFQDTNGDGVGDLRGIIARLDHIQSLGVDGIWISPFFTSPMHDYGYDVADFCGVDPIFGTLEDFDDLIAAAHARNLKVIIDQVYSHTSDEHPWFEESRQSKVNDRSDWYVWADPKPAGGPPNNWQSVFGGPSWQWEPRRQQYYLHNFLIEQPDLNLHNPEVQDAILDVTRFWLDRGVDGFRLDALNFGMHNPNLTDNPPETDFARPPTRPFDYQKHVHNMSQPEIVDFIARIRRVIDEYDACFTVAEVGGPRPLGEMKAFTAGETHLNSAYSFDFLYADDLTPTRIQNSLKDWPGAPGEGWPSWAFSNHDAPRAISRWCHDESERDSYAKLLGLLLISLRGNVFVYQGEELGLPQAHVPFEHLKDPEAIANWPETLGRDGARTPMVWTKSEKHAGFTNGTPWLPIDPAHTPRAADQQENKPDSVLNYFRDVIAFRRDCNILRTGDLEFLSAPAGGLIIRRQSGNAQRLCVFNLSDDALDLPADIAPVKSAMIAGHELNDGQLPAFSGFISEIF